MLIPPDIVRCLGRMGNTLCFNRLKCARYLALDQRDDNTPPDARWLCTSDWAYHVVIEIKETDNA